jgi:hypothetical protein
MNRSSPDSSTARLQLPPESGHASHDALNAPYFSLFLLDSGFNISMDAPPPL